MRFRVPHEIPQPTAVELLSRAWPEADKGDLYRVIGGGRLRVDDRVSKNPARKLDPDGIVTVDVANEAYESFGVPDAGELARGDGFVIVDKPFGMPGYREPDDPVDPVAFLADVLGLDRETFTPVWNAPLNAGGPWLCADSPESAQRLREELSSGELVTWWTAVVPVFGLPTGELEYDGIEISYASARIVGGICEVQLKPNFSTATNVARAAELLCDALAAQGAPVLGDRERGGYMVDGGLRLRMMSLYDSTGTISEGWTTPAGWFPEQPVAPRLEPEKPEQKPRAVPRFRVSPKTLEVLGAGHFWVLPDAQTDPLDEFTPGDLVRLESPDGKSGPYALIDGASEIAARVWSRDDEAATDLWGEVDLRVDEAFARRSDLFRHLDTTDLFRVIHGEADGLPGLFVDRVGPMYRATLMGRAAWQLKDRVYELISDFEPDTMILEVAHVGDVRSEGQLPRARIVHEGARYVRPDERIIGREAGLQYWCEPWEGVDTGFFADQRDNRGAAVNAAKPGQRWLNLFCHTGAFSVALAAAGAHVVSVDISERYLEWLAENLILNGLDLSLNRNVAADAREFVSNDDGEYDGIIVDPPTAASSEAGFWSVHKDYKALLADCFARLAPGGRILVCRNARRRKPSLEELVREAASRKGRIEPAPPSLDYPRLASIPEGDSFEGLWWLAEGA